MELILSERHTCINRDNLQGKIFDSSLFCIARNARPEQDFHGTPDPINSMAKHMQACQLLPKHIPRQANKSQT